MIHEKYSLLSVSLMEIIGKLIHWWQKKIIVHRKPYIIQYKNSPRFITVSSTYTIHFVKFGSNSFVKINVQSCFNLLTNQ